MASLDLPERGSRPSSDDTDGVGGSELRASVFTPDVGISISLCAFGGAHRTPFLPSILLTSIRHTDAASTPLLTSIDEMTKADED
jgi:hypothetical protein